MMRTIAVLVVAATMGGCGERGQAPEVPAGTAGMPGGAEPRVSPSDGVVPLPTDQAQLDRLILQGYTPHADHLHLPGAKSCPLSRGNDAIM